MHKNIYIYIYAWSPIPSHFELCSYIAIIFHQCTHFDLTDLQAILICSISLKTKNFIINAALPNKNTYFLNSLRTIISFSIHIITLLKKFAKCDTIQRNYEIIDPIIDAFSLSYELVISEFSELRS